MAILICGGAGYIGSHVNKLLSSRGIDTIVFDNLSRGRRELVKWGTFVHGDLGDVSALRRVFGEYNIGAVVHLAAYSYVGESVADPATYYRNNVANTLNLLDAMREYECGRIIFSSTCAIFGEPETIPITEDTPQNPVNPYGTTKQIVERVFKDYAAAYGLKYVTLRYFNAAGADPTGEIGEWHEPETHLIPLVLDTADGKLESVNIFGTDYPTRDGTCVRDYIHVSDLAAAHLLALEYLDCGGASDCFNLGSAAGTSVLEVIEAVKKVTGRDIAVNLAPRRAGDPPVLVGDSAKAKRVLGWEPEFGDIETIVSHAWAWQKRMSEGTIIDVANSVRTQG
jgi:UDP-glucose 4-epimerase